MDNLSTREEVARMTFEECEEYIKKHKEQLTSEQIANMIGILRVLIDITQQTKDIVCNHICDLREGAVTKADEAIFVGKHAAYDEARFAINKLYVDYVSDLFVELKRKSGVNGRKKKSRR